MILGWIFSYTTITRISYLRHADRKSQLVLKFCLVFIHAQREVPVPLLNSCCPLFNVFGMEEGLDDLSLCLLKKILHFLANFLEDIKNWKDEYYHITKTIKVFWPDCLTLNYLSATRKLLPFGRMRDNKKWFSNSCSVWCVKRSIEFPIFVHHYVMVFTGLVKTDWKNIDNKTDSTVMPGNRLTQEVLSWHRR